MTILQTIHGPPGHTAYKVIRLLPGKHNRVYLVQGPREQVVLKQFHDPADRQREACWLKQAGEKQLVVPALLARSETTLVLSYFPGHTLLDRLVALERKQVPPQSGPFQHLANCLCTWLQAFYGAFPTTGLNDMNWRNFIATQPDGTSQAKGPRIARVDLEACAHGSAARDAGRMAAFLLAYRPAFSAWKLAAGSLFLHRLCACLHIQRPACVHALRLELAAMEKRRGQTIPWSTLDSLLT